MTSTSDRAPAVPAVAVPTEPVAIPAPFSRSAVQVPDAWTTSSSQAAGVAPRGNPAVEGEIPAYMTSRLAGIRKLLVSLGRRSVAQDAAIAGKDSDFEPRLERATVRPAYNARGPLEGDAAARGNSASSARVTVRPEILRPRPAVEVDREKEPLRPTVPQPPRGKADAQDEIETLPSVRGQYRKKRYPPI